MTRGTAINPCLFLFAHHDKTPAQAEIVVTADAIRTARIIKRPILVPQNGLRRCPGASRFKSSFILKMTYRFQWNHCGTGTIYTADDTTERKDSFVYQKLYDEEQWESDDPSDFDVSDSAVTSSEIDSVQDSSPEVARILTINPFAPSKALSSKPERHDRVGLQRSASVVVSAPQKLSQPRTVSSLSKIQTTNDPTPGENLPHPSRPFQPTNTLMQPSNTSIQPTNTLLQTSNTLVQPGGDPMQQTNTPLMVIDNPIQPSVSHYFTTHSTRSADCELTTSIQATPQTEVPLPGKVNAPSLLHAIESPPPSQILNCIQPNRDQKQAEQLEMQTTRENSPPQIIKTEPVLRTIPKIVGPKNVGRGLGLNKKVRVR